MDGFGADMKIVEVNGASLAHLERGEGDSVIFVHETYTNALVKLGATWYNFDSSSPRYLSESSIHTGTKNSANSYDVWDKDRS